MSSCRHNAPSWKKQYFNDKHLHMVTCQPLMLWYSQMLGEEWFSEEMPIVGAALSFEGGHL